jgi:hypothetical protein
MSNPKNNNNFESVTPISATSNVVQINRDTSASQLTEIVAPYSSVGLHHSSSRHPAKDNKNDIHKTVASEGNAKQSTLSQHKQQANCQQEQRVLDMLYQNTK